MSNLAKLTAEYEEKIGTVPNRYKNDEKWIAGKLAPDEPAEKAIEPEKAIAPIKTISPSIIVGTILKKSIIHNGKIYQAGDICPDGVNKGSLAFRDII